MNLGINLSTNAKELKSSYQSVLDGKDVNWVVYGYERGNELKVMAKGDGGLEELKDEFDESKIQYAFARVIDPNSDLPKLVLIGWCGEGVPDFKKGFFNSHFNEVTKFLKGYHLQINARSETDVEPDYIMKRINESGGSKYMANVNKNAPLKKDDPILPVRSVYQPERIPNIAALQKTAAKEPILPVRSVYQPEKIPNITELQKTTSKEEEPARLGYQPEKIPDIAELQRTAPKDDIKPVSSVYKPVQLPKPKKLGTRATWVTTEENNPPASSSSVRRDREEREKKEREKEERERKERERKDRERKDREKKDRERKEREECERLEQEEREREEFERAERERQEQEEYERKESERAEQEEYEREERERTERLGQQREADNRAKKLKEEQRREREEREREERERKERERKEREREERERKEREREEKLRQKREKEEYERQELERQQREEEEANRREEEEILRLQEADQSNVESAGSYFARALYDYEAGEDNEMSLVEGEIIKDIVQLDEGWWQGVSEDGTRSGLFPANFVELVDAEALNSEEHIQEPELEPEPEPQEAEQPTMPSAKAVYDYDAGEPNEISFAEGDIITNIDFVSEDWWQGTAHDGSIGLFPANYVELIE